MWKMVELYVKIPPFPQKMRLCQNIDTISFFICKTQTLDQRKRLPAHLQDQSNLKYLQEAEGDNHWNPY